MGGGRPNSPVLSCSFWIEPAYPELVHGDGDGWVISDSGAHYWGRYGAAGLLLRAPQPDGTPAVLLQHRAVWSHQGGTWSLPGGARDSHESAEETAVREAREEAGLAAERLTVRATVVTAEVAGVSGVRWTYTTVVADAGELLHTVPNRESTELRWVGEDEVAELPLHPGFAASWQRLRTAPALVPLGDGDERRQRLPRTMEVDAGVFVWCMPGDADQAPSQLSRRVSSLLQAPT
jgi:8-oxo-dGTP diphosphatase